MDQTAALERAGFWRRFWALAVDLFIVGALVQTIAIPAYIFSDGRIQSAGVIRTKQCVALPSVPHMPPGFEFPFKDPPNYATICILSFFGLETARILEIGRETHTGDKNSIITTSGGTWVRYPLDRHNRIGAYPLDLIIPPIFFLLRLLFDGGPGTVGRRLLGIRLVKALATEILSPGIGASARRYAILAIPFALVWVIQVYAGLFATIAMLPRLLPLTIGTGLIALVVAIIAIVSIVRRRDTFYDRFAGTAVVRTSRSKAGPADPGPTE